MQYVLMQIVKASANAYLFQIDGYVSKLYSPSLWSINLQVIQVLQGLV